MDFTVLPTWEVPLEEDITGQMLTLYQLDIWHFDSVITLWTSMLNYPQMYEYLGVLVRFTNMGYVTLANITWKACVNPLWDMALDKK